MKKETFIAILTTFLVTSLLWLFIYLVVLPAAKSPARHTDEAVEQPAATPSQSEAEAPAYQANANRRVDYTESIIGHWTPVEVSEIELDFSQYGTLKTLSHKHGHPVTTQYKYQLLGDQMGYTLMADFYEGDWHRIEIETTADGKTYLSIFDDPELGGRYSKQ